MPADSRSLLSRDSGFRGQTRQQCTEMQGRWWPSDNSRSCIELAFLEWLPQATLCPGILKSNKDTPYTPGASVPQAAGRGVIRGPVPPTHPTPTPRPPVPGPPLIPSTLQCPRSRDFSILTGWQAGAQVFPLSPHPFWKKPEPQVPLLTLGSPQMDECPSLPTPAGHLRGLPPAACPPVGLREYSALERLGYISSALGTDPSSQFWPLQTWFLSSESPI